MRSIWNMLKSLWPSLLTTVAGLTLAAYLGPGWAANTYLQRPDVSAFVNRMVEEHNYDKKTLERVFTEAQYKQSIIDAITRPAEKRLQWWEYRRIFLKEKRINSGVDFWRKHQDLIQQVADSYGVDPQIIIAIIGVETRYGNITGSYRVVDSLSTLGFDYEPRGKFFRGQLEEFLLLAQEENLDPLGFTGSYAGAMGYGQFIPSSYRAYAVDFDKDGYRDIWDNIPDAVGSVANYLKRHKWRRGEPIVHQIKASGAAFVAKVSKKLRANRTVGELKALGVQSDLPDDRRVGLIELMEEDGPDYRLADHNFYVITKYNRSFLYAMAVYDLSEAILARYQQASR